ncbi:MAG TPA: 6-phosphogluconolactonase [Pseudolabrys sp.]|nr:6-phosphogluconolactonase [Pseudolabrys sp.]
MTLAQEAHLEIVADHEALARQTADWVLAVAREHNDRIAIALSGGSTPRRLYELLGEQPWRDTFPWRRTHWFWGDERFVPENDARSNYRMVREALLAQAPIPADHIHPIPTDAATPAAAADAYQRTLQSFYGAQRLDPARPLFDIMLLGLGADGHTASLLPGSPALAEKDRWVMAVPAGAPEPRITLTYPALQSTRHTAFLVVGAEKRSAFARARGGDQALPAGRLRPLGDLHWFADATAAGNPE